MAYNVHATVIAKVEAAAKSTTGFPEVLPVKDAIKLTI